MDNKENHFNGDIDAYEEQANSGVVYERTRIKPLAEQREEVQKKTFTNWLNSHLKKRKQRDTEPVIDLFSDLKDGKTLINLLEILSGDKLPKPEKGKMRIHCIENVAKCLQFLLSQHVYLENMGAHDIVDGNQTLTLGLIWTIILRYQIQDIQYDVEDSATRTPKDALLLWCQMKTANYHNVNIRNFTTSWKDGLGFAALLHKHKPEVVEFMTMTKERPVENMNTAFEGFKNEFDVDEILDSKDIIVDQPDEKSIITYVALIYEKVNKLKETSVQGKRVGRIVDIGIEIEHIENEYEKLCSDLLNWVHNKIDWLDKEPLKRSLPEVKEQLDEFSQYRREEKPPRFEQRGRLEMLFFEIQSKLMANKRKLYIPSEGKLISDINRAWEDLEKSEHGMEMRLYEELIRQQKLEQLGDRFNRKAQMREAWLIENDRLVHQDVFGDDLVTVDAAIKKHEALEGDIYAHEERINALGYILDELETENYYKAEAIRQRNDEIIDLWRVLLENLQKRRDKLDNCREIQLILQERSYTMEWITEFINRFKSVDFSKHMLGVDSLLENHKILVGDSKNIEPKISYINDRISNFDLEEAGMDADQVNNKFDRLNEMYKDMLQLAENRENGLLKMRKIWEYIEDLENDKEWLKEVNQLMLNPDIGHDLSSVERMVRKHNQLVGDINKRKDNILNKLELGDEKSSEEDNVERKELLNNAINEVRDLIEGLNDNLHYRTSRLDEANLYYQLLADIDDNDNTILELIRIFENNDVGDKLILTEFYLKKYDEQMLQVNDVEAAKDELLDRYVNLNQEQFDEIRVTNLSTARDKMDEDFDKLKIQTELRFELLNKSKQKFESLKDMDAIETWIVAKEKFLKTLVPTEEIDELNVIKHRFDCFEDEMKNNANNVSDINILCKKLAEAQVPDSDILTERTNQLNTDWNDLADLQESKRRELDMSIGYNQFLVECQATCQWIEEKIKLLEWSDDLRDDLDGVMQLQRRLGSLERDVKAIEAKVQYLNRQVPDMKEHKPAAEVSIDDEISAVNDGWERLKIMLEDRDAKLHSSSQLQKFLQDLDAFNVWLSKVQTLAASLDIPRDLAEAEKFYAQHQQLMEEIKCWEPEFMRLLDFGREITHSKEESQYILFNQRLDALEKGWETLHKMCNDKSLELQRSIDAQTFFRDSQQIDVILNKQETFLSNEELPTTMETAQNAERQFENFKDSVAANKPKIEHLMVFGEGLLENNALSEKIKHKCEQIQERSDAIDEKIRLKNKQIKDNMKLITYLEDVMDFEEWIAEKIMVASDISGRDTKDVSSRYNRFRDFERELEANEDKLHSVVKNGHDMIESNPEFTETIEPKVAALEEQWNNLTESTKTQSQQIEEANREVLFDDNARTVMTWMTEIESQIITTEESCEEISLVELDQKMKNQEEQDRQLDQKKKMLTDMEMHAEKLKQQYPEREQEFEEVQQQVRVKLTQVEAPMRSRQNRLGQQKRVLQFQRDVADEFEWMQHKSQVAASLQSPQPDNLQHSQQKQRRFNTLNIEVDNHQPRIDEIIQEGEYLLNDGVANVPKFENDIKSLQEAWENLAHDLDGCGLCLDNYKIVSEYLFDANVSSEWIEDREIDLLKDEKVKDRDGAQNASRKNDEVMKVIDEYEDTIYGNLARQHIKIVDAQLPGHELVTTTQKQLERSYVQLLDMCRDRQFRIEDLITLYTLHIKIQDLEEWIVERTVVASSNEIGSDLEHCSLLRERFSEFAKETNEMGSERVSAAEKECDALIEQGHQEAAQIACWKDLINEIWADLLELIETRIQLLKSAWDFYKFMSDSAELLEMTQEKVHQIPETVGRDAKSVAAYLRRHTAFTAEIERLWPLIQAQIEVADRLRPLYSGPREAEIVERKHQLEQWWNRLQQDIEAHRLSIVDNGDLHRFLNMVRELLDWYSQIQLQITSEDKPRDCCGVDLIISNHRSLKAEIDSRDENLSVCMGLGRTLINNKHKSRTDIRRKCREVTQKHFLLVESWRDRKEYLDLLHEVYQFAREAAVAEAWIVAQEPQVHSDSYGENLGETLQLLGRHEALERSLAVQLDRFEALRRRTKLEEQAENDKDGAKSNKQQDREHRLQEAIREFLTPPPTPEPVRKQEKPVVMSGESAARPDSGMRADTSVHSDNDQVEDMVTPTVTSPEKAEQSPVFPSAAGSPTAPTEPHSGHLVRKHEWETGGLKKAPSRAWHDLYCVLEAGVLRFYKDEKRYRDQQQTGTYKGEAPLFLVGASAAPAELYKKREFVIRLKLGDGAEYLLQARTAAEMADWIDAINKTAGSSDAAASGQQYSTLPTSRTPGTKDSGKRKFTTLGRKK